MGRRTWMLMAVTFIASAGCEREGGDAGAIRARGLAQLDSGHYDNAIALLDSAIALQPGDADAWNSRGNAYASKRETDRAIQSYDSAIALRPTSPFAYKNRGASFATRDDFDRAIADFDKAISLKPDFAGAYNSRGFAYHLKGDYARAEQDYGKAIELAPEGSAAYRNRANARFILGKFADAASDLQQALALHKGRSPTAPDRYLDETGAYTVVWHHVAKVRAGQHDASAPVANAAQVDSATWPGPVLAFFAGRMTADQLVAWTANAEERLRSDQHCGAQFFTGQVAMAQKRAAEARKRFEATRASCSKRYTEHLAAVADLRRLDSAAVR